MRHGHHGAAVTQSPRLPVSHLGCLSILLLLLLLPLYLLLLAGLLLLHPAPHTPCCSSSTVASCYAIILTVICPRVTVT